MIDPILNSNGHDTQSRTRQIDDYLKILYALALQYHRNTGIEIEELFQEVCLAYTQAMPKYNSIKSSLSTFVTVIARNHLNTYVAKSKLKNPPLIHISEQEDRTMLDHRSPDQDILFRSQLKSLKSDARQICYFIFTEPDRFTNSKAIAKFLKSIGWSGSRITNSLREIRRILR